MTAALARDYEDSDEWVPWAEAAKELGVAPSTLQRYARDGKLLRLYHANRVYTTRTSLADYRRRCMVEAEAKRVATEKSARRKRR